MNVVRASKDGYIEDYQFQPVPSGKTVEFKAINLSDENPFKDTSDTDILKAYNSGIVFGISKTAFEPNSLLNREQAATMLSRTINAVYPDIVIDATGSTSFADDEKISDWAKPNVYFMSKNGIIGGIGNNIFGPKNITSAETAQGYANATREQAILIATHSLEKFGSK